MGIVHSHMNDKNAVTAHKQITSTSNYK